jgi:flagellar protein FliL
MPDAAEKIPGSEQIEAPPAKSRKKLLIIALAALLVIGGGGFYFFRVRTAAAADAAKAKDKGEKKKKSKEDEEAAPAGDEKSPAESGNSKKVLEISVPDDSEVKQVVELQPFIVNLADDSEPRYLRMTVSVGLAESGEVKPDPLFTTKVRNAMLAILTSKRSEEILTVEGKATLRKELLRAAQAAVSEPEVHAIYITDFIVQL